MQSAALAGGFTNPAHESSHAFRALMEVMARPGEIRVMRGAIPPQPMSPAAGALLLTLCDADTPIHLAGAVDCQEVRDWIAFHVGAPLAGAGQCMFALGRWDDLMPLSDFAIGTAEYPDRAATLIVEADDLVAQGAVLAGPGIRDTAALSLPDKRAFQANSTLFPLGLDFFFTRGDHVAALPRSTKVT